MQELVDYRNYFVTIPGIQLMTTTKPEPVEALVLESLPNTMFKIRYDDGEEGIAYLAGKMKLHRIRVLVGDTVEVARDPYGGKGRIQRRK